MTVQALDDRRIDPGRCNNAEPSGGFVAGQPSFGHRGVIGKSLQSPGCSHSQRAQRSGLDVLDHRCSRNGHEANMSADQVVDGRSRATERHMHHFNPRHPRELVCSEVVGCTHTRRSIGNGTRMRFCVSDELGQRLERD